MTLPLHIRFSADALVRDVRQQLDRYDTFSFDLFDTLVIRRIARPDDLKPAVCRYLSERARQAHITRWPPERILRLRNRVEALHRRRNGQAGPDHEAHYPSFMADVLHIIFKPEVPPGLLEDTLAYELEVERSMLVPRQAFIPLLQDLRRAGKTILIVSDMYLPADALRRLLDQIHYPPLYDALVSSADTLRAKASGAAWPLVKEKYNLDPARWLHIGDHPVSDGLCPARFGITSWVLRDLHELRRLATLRLGRAMPAAQGGHFQRVMSPLEGEKTNAAPLYDYGYQFIGFLLCAFIHHLTEQLRAEGIGHVFFFSREGRLLQSIWDHLAPRICEGGTPPPPSTYLHVSRLALAPAACHPEGLTPALADIALLPGENKSLRDICRVYALPCETIAPFLADAQLTLDTPLKKSGRAIRRRLAGLLQNPGFQSAVKSATADPHRALMSYLESTGFFSHPRVALVDIGWLGTMQRYLHHAVSPHPTCPALHGFLLANTEGYPFPYSPRNNLDGFLYDENHPTLRGSLINLFKVPLEEIARPDEPTLMAYQWLDNRCKLVFKEGSPRETEPPNPVLDPIRRGLNDLVPRYADAIRVTACSPRDLLPRLRHLLLRQIAFPSFDLLRDLTNLRHVNDFIPADKAGHPPPLLFQTLWSFPPASRLLLLPRQLMHLLKFLALHAALRIKTRRRA